MSHTLGWWLQVMKMVMTLLAPAAGKVHFRMLEGSLLAPGDLIARLELENPEAAQQVTPYTGNFPELGLPLVQSLKVDQRFKTSLAAAKNVLQGEISAMFISAASAVHLRWTFEA